MESEDDQHIVTKKFIQERFKTKRQLREFFLENCGDYTPPMSDFTAEWARAVFNGEKKHLQISDLYWVHDVPRDPNLTVKKLFAMAKADE